MLDADIFTGTRTLCELAVLSIFSLLPIKLSYNKVNVKNINGPSFIPIKKINQLKFVEKSIKITN